MDLSSNKCNMMVTVINDGMLCGGGGWVGGEQGEVLRGMGHNPKWWLFCNITLMPISYFFSKQALWFRVLFCSYCTLLQGILAGTVGEPKPNVYLQTVLVHYGVSLSWAVRDPNPEFIFRQCWCIMGYPYLICCERIFPRYIFKQCWWKLHNKQNCITLDS